MRGRLLVVAALLAWHIVAAHRYVPVWRSDHALWTHAQLMAPGKLRPQLNLDKAQFAAGSTR